MVTHIFSNARQRQKKTITYCPIKISFLCFFVFLLAQRRYKTNKRKKCKKKKSRREKYNKTYTKYTIGKKYRKQRPKKNLIAKCIINTSNYHNDMKHDE